MSLIKISIQIIQCNPGHKIIIQHRFEYLNFQGFFVFESVIAINVHLFFLFFSVVFVATQSGHPLGSRLFSTLTSHPGLVFFNSLVLFVVQPKLKNAIRKWYISYFPGRRIFMRNGSDFYLALSTVCGICLVGPEFNSMALCKEPTACPLQLSLYTVLFISLSTGWIYPWCSGIQLHHAFVLTLYLPFLSIAVITVEPADKISFVYNCMQTRLRGQYNGK